MTDIAIARESAAAAQANESVAAMIRSGKFDAWPNVLAALIAIRGVRQWPPRPERWWLQRQHRQ